MDIRELSRISDSVDFDAEDEKIRKNLKKTNDYLSKFTSNENCDVILSDLTNQLRDNGFSVEKKDGHKKLYFTKSNTGYLVELKPTDHGSIIWTLKSKQAESDSYKRVGSDVAMLPSSIEIENKYLVKRIISMLQSTHVDDSREEDYRTAAKELKDNFYAQLLSKVETFVRRSDKAKDTEKKTESSILGNDVMLKYIPNNGNIYVYVNGIEVYKDKYGKGNSINSVVECVKAEIGNKVNISRPDGRTIQKDRQDFTEKNIEKLGITFPKSVYKAMEGKGESNIVKKNFKQQMFLKPSDYEYLIKNNQIESSDYDNLGDFYIKSSTPHFEIKGEYGGLLTHLDEAIAREEGLLEFTDGLGTQKGVLIYKGEPFVFYNDEVKKYNLK